jgi:RNA polymerase sigma-70 factor, ECF subfamily
MTPDEISRLYRKFGPIIYRRCLRFLADPEQAADATQEVFVRAMRHREKLLNDREGLPWLYKVTTNYCINRLRARTTTKLVPLPETLQDREAARADQKVLIRDQLSKWLARFDAITSQIALHFHLDGMTQEEIAAAMGLSRRTVGKKLKEVKMVAKRAVVEGELS